MPFGLSNAPAVFQVLVNDVLRDMLNRFVFVYIDNILIYSQNPVEHEQHMRHVLQRLMENRLFVKAEKCVFHAPSVTFRSGCSGDGPCQGGCSGTVVRSYSSIAAPLTALTSTSLPFRWSSTAETAFNDLKHWFVSAPVLSHPDTNLQFVVEVDASDTGVGAILSQRSPSDGKFHPCAFFSRCLTSPERNYDVGNRELLAVKLALEEWRHWLEGTAQPFVVWTDHRNLKYIQSPKRLNSRQVRWALFFWPFQFFTHLPARLPEHQGRCTVPTVLL